MTSIACEHGRARAGVDGARRRLVLVLALVTTAIALGGLLAASAALGGHGASAGAGVPVAHVDNGRADSIACTPGEVAYVDRVDAAVGCDVTVQHVAAAEYPG